MDNNKGAAIAAQMGFDPELLNLTQVVEIETIHIEQEQVEDLDRMDSEFYYLDAESGQMIEATEEDWDTLDQCSNDWLDR